MKTFVRKVAVTLLGKTVEPPGKSHFYIHSQTQKIEMCIPQVKATLSAKSRAAIWPPKLYSAIGAGDPEYVFFAILVEVPGELEQVVRKPIHVLERLCVDSFGLC